MNVAPEPDAETDDDRDPLVDQFAWAARSLLRLMLTGPSGSGKTHLARRLHLASGRRGSFVTVDCPAIEPTLFTSALFGHERGAFTGADAARPGLVTLARGGTLFFEEVGDLAPSNQARLLSFLGVERYRPLGSERERPADVRVMCASNLDLREALRPELYRRLAGVVIPVPPLAERPDEVLVIAGRLCERWAQREGRRCRPLGPDARALLLARSWEDNIGGLETAVHAALIRADDEGAAQLCRRHFEAAPTPTASTHAARMAAFERELIGDTLRATSGNVSEAARRLGLRRQQVHARMRQLGLVRQS